MKFHNQMIKKAYDHTAQILYSLLYDNEFMMVKSLANEKDRIYRAVHNDYKYQAIALNQLDFFYDSRYYETLITELAVEVQMSAGMAEQNMILYNVSKIIDSVDAKLKLGDGKRNFTNIGFIGIDMTKQQLFITDIENNYCVSFQLMIDRNMNQAFQAGNNFQYYIRFRFLKRTSEEQG